MEIKKGDIIRNMTDAELANFLAAIVSCCSEAGYHGNGIYDGIPYCNGFGCPLEDACNIQKNIKIQGNGEVFCSEEAILKWLSE